MSSNYIHALKAPAPDTLYITSLKKLRLAYRGRIREAIRQKRTSSTAAHSRRWPPAGAVAPASVRQLGGGH